MTKIDLKKSSTTEIESLIRRDKRKERYLIRWRHIVSEHPSQLPQLKCAIRQRYGVRQRIGVRCTTANDRLDEAIDDIHGIGQCAHANEDSLQTVSGQCIVCCHALAQRCCGCSIREHKGFFGCYREFLGNSIIRDIEVVSLRLRND